MKKLTGFVLLFAFLLAAAGCTESGEFDPAREINVIAREDGSGTRGAFVELLGIVEKTETTKKDLTTKEAVIAKQTDVLISSIANDKYSVGYISLGSLGGSVKALKIDGITANSENIKNGSYPVSRIFRLATMSELSYPAKDFIDFVLSREGQEIVAMDYISYLDDAPAYSGRNVTGKVVIAGSSSVSPVMEKLKEAYIKLNPDVNIEIQLSDSSSGLISAIEGRCDIAMSSRDLTKSEEESLSATAIALDGIIIVVNPQNPLENLTREQARSIYIGETLNWSEVLP